MLHGLLILRISVYKYLAWVRNPKPCFKLFRNQHEAFLSLFRVWIFFRWNACWNPWGWGMYLYLYKKQKDVSCHKSQVMLYSSWNFLSFILYLKSHKLWMSILCTFLQSSSWGLRLWGSNVKVIKIQKGTKYRVRICTVTYIYCCLPSTFPIS